MSMKRTDFSIGKQNVFCCCSIQLCNLDKFFFITILFSSNLKKKSYFLSMNSMSTCARSTQSSSCGCNTPRKW